MRKMQIAIGIVLLMLFFGSTQWLAKQDAGPTVPTIPPSIDVSSASPVSFTPTNSPEVFGLQAEQTPIPTTTMNSMQEIPLQDSLQKATIVNVVDGDTVDVSVNGNKERLRVIGINTPETVDPRRPVECFAKEASDMAKTLLQENETVFLETDPSQGERDKYQRKLAYVWLDNGNRDYGKTMIEVGMASEYTYNTPYAYQEIYRSAENEARTAKRGLWGDGVCASSQEQETSSTDKDCADFTMQKDAQNYFLGKGGSSTNNVDKLDQDHDGVACETLP